MGGWGWGQIQIKCHEINKISTLTPTNNSLQNAMNFGIFLLLSFLTVLLFLKSWHMGLIERQQFNFLDLFPFFFFVDCKRVDVKFFSCFWKDNILFSLSQN